MWSVEGTDEFAAWYATLALEQQDALAARIELLERYGPNLKRPVVGEILSSRHAPHLKELRVSAEGHLRVLFAFDPRRTAILLLGGDKTGRWDEWYRAAIPEADRQYDLYLEELRSEGII
ncbi:MAG TPA: type II toxin-antitoxin system RelE/ParE family toxin [Ktedonobacterales bacterium]|nr:type II toxin-antitoxin system RelE/ParE family toxin [Ktedonobacterales bacterium]